MKLLNGMCVFGANLPARRASFSKQKSLSIMLITFIPYAHPHHYTLIHTYTKLITVWQCQIRD